MIATNIFLFWGRLESYYTSYCVVYMLFYAWTLKYLSDKILIDSAQPSVWIKKEGAAFKRKPWQCPLSTHCSRSLHIIFFLTLLFSYIQHICFKSPREEMWLWWERPTPFYMFASLNERNTPPYILWNVSNKHRIVTAWYYWLNLKIVSDSQMQLGCSVLLIRWSKRQITGDSNGWKLAQAGPRDLWALVEGQKCV